MNDDGSGTLSILSALDAEALRAFAEDGGAEIESPFSDLDAADLPPGATVEAYDEDGFIGVRASVPFAAGDDVPDAIEAVLSDAGDDLSGELAGTAGLFERFDLYRDGGGWRFDAVVSPLNQEALSGGDGDALGVALWPRSCWKTLRSPSGSSCQATSRSTTPTWSTAARWSGASTSSQISRAT